MTSRTSRTKKKPGDKGYRRTRADVEAVKAAAHEELEAGHPMTLRQIHYRLVSRPDVYYRNTVSDYGSLSEWLRDARLDGSIPWEWMEDRLRVPRRPPMWDDLPSFIGAVRRSYRRDVWQDQPGYLEVWLEKDALSGIFEAALHPYGVTLNVGRGFDGWSSVKNAADRYGDGAGVTVLYFGDFDPSGEDMVRSLRERLAHPDLPGGDSLPEIVKCALTFEDIERYDLPPDFTKTTDSRRDAFVALYGDVAVELDALPVDVLRRRLIREVAARMDLDALAETRERQASDQGRLDELLDGLED
ncbi:MAG: hypothetical protein M3R38_27435 [Actinomycetota bacterium]|nr:hypothetical protein [Actinomycetota bacterium]